MAGITSEGIRRLEIFIPPRELQERFAAYVRVVGQKRTERRRAAAQLDGLFQTLSRDAFSGALTARWRETRMSELLQEMEHQAKDLANAESVGT